PWVVQLKYRRHIPHLLDNARDHQRSKPLRIRSDHEKPDLPRDRDREEAVEELRVLERRRVPPSGHVDEKKEWSHHGDAPHTREQKDDSCKLHGPAPDRKHESLASGFPP